MKVETHENVQVLVLDFFVEIIMIIRISIAVKLSI
jgi:hypothetical protein